MLFYYFQQLRKLLLEIIHRIPTNDHLRPHYKVYRKFIFSKLVRLHFTLVASVANFTLQQLSICECSKNYSVLKTNNDVIFFAEYSHSNVSFVGSKFKSLQIYI